VTAKAEERWKGAVKACGEEEENETKRTKKWKLKKKNEEEYRGRQEVGSIKCEKQFFSRHSKHFSFTHKKCLTV
jgi:hypothetical protein